ncbi:MAG: ATP synthase subunit I [Lachnospiraceae bacterium]
MKKAKQILKEMFAGLLVWLVPVLIILVIIARNKLAMAAGVLLGGMAAAGLLLHMFHNLDIALDLDVKHAQRHMQLATLKRFFFMAVVLAVSMAGYKYVHPVGTVLGMFGMKISAYLQPVVHKAAGRIQRW